MRYLVVLIGWLWLVNSKIKAQDTIVYYLDESWNRTSEENAAYFRKAIKVKKGQWNVEDYFICGHLQMTGTFKSNRFKKKHGHFKYYFKNGGIDSEGNFSNNKKEGIWTWYFRNGIVSSKETYLKGEVVDISFWDEDGCEVKGEREPIEYPEFVGGIEEMYNFLNMHLEYPQWAKINNVKGSVTVNFIIEEDGSIEHVETIESDHPLLDRAAIDVVRKMPRWKPGKYHNRYHRTSMHLPINFKITNF